MRYREPLGAAIMAGPGKAGVWPEDGQLAACDKNNNMRPLSVWFVSVIAAFACDASAASWQLSAGATTDDGQALEVSRRSEKWEVALGYFTEQTVLIRYIMPVCPYQGAPAESCAVNVRRAHQPVDPYVYLSVQRRFEFRQRALVRPVFGLGLVGQSDTNPYVSTPVNLSLSVGVEIGSRVSLEWRHFSNAGIEGPNLGQDTVLVRWTFP